MNTYYGGSYIHIYICTDHKDERWDTQMSGEKPFCIPCEIKRLRRENADLKEQAGEKE
jgi:hypothetical protein